MPPTRPPSLILDADIVIYLHKIGIWHRLCETVEVAVPRTVIGEARYFKDEWKGQRVKIDLEAQVDSGGIIALEATAEDIVTLQQHCGRLVLEGLHSGEREALALLFCGKAEQYTFCTGDQAAIRALVVLCLADKSMSLENVLRSVGLGRQVEKQYSDNRYREYIKQARVDHLTGWWR